MSTIEILPQQPPRDVIRDVCRAWGMPVALVMTGTVRRRRVTLARHACIHALRRAFPDMSSGDIGAELQLDHTSVLYALKRSSVAANEATA